MNPPLPTSTGGTGQEEKPDHIGEANEMVPTAYEFVTKEEIEQFAKWLDDARVGGGNFVRRIGAEREAFQEVAKHERRKAQGLIDALNSIGRGMSDIRGWVGKTVTEAVIMAIARYEALTTDLDSEAKRLLSEKKGDPDFKSDNQGDSNAT